MVKIKYSGIKKTFAIFQKLLNVPFVKCFFLRFLNSCIDFLMRFFLSLKIAHSMSDKLPGLAKVLSQFQSSKTKPKCSNAKVTEWPH